MGREICLSSIHSICQAVLERGFSEEVSRKPYCSSSCTEQLSAQIGKPSFLLVCRCSDVKAVNRVFLHLPWAPAGHWPSWISSRVPSRGLCSLCSFWLVFPSRTESPLHLKLLCPVALLRLESELACLFWKLLSPGPLMLSQESPGIGGGGVGVFLAAVRGLLSPLPTSLLRSPLLSYFFFLFFAYRLEFET